MENENRFLTFSLGKEIFAIEIIKIQEIFAYPELLTNLPGTSESVKGVINLRGEVTPVIDLRIRFSITDEPSYDGDTIVIAVYTTDKRMIGVVVDKINTIENIDLTKLSKSPDIGISMDSQFIEGLFKNKEGLMIAIMDIDNLLSKEQIDKL